VAKARNEKTLRARLSGTKGAKGGETERNEAFYQIGFFFATEESETTEEAQAHDSLWKIGHAEVGARSVWGPGRG
jgi:hypothetical protein